MGIVYAVISIFLIYYYKSITRYNVSVLFHARKYKTYNYDKVKHYAVNYLQGFWAIVFLVNLES